jgi:putative intracellular protease/amidase
VDRSRSRRGPRSPDDIVASLKTDLVNAGAEWVDEEVGVDGNLITSRKPDDIPAFNREIISALSHEPVGV